MIRELFCAVLDISVISGIFILIIAILRVTLRRSPKWVRYFLWILVAVRLLCPVFLESGFSILPDKIFSVTGNIIKTSTMQLKQVQSVEGHQGVLNILSIIWLAGIVILFLRLVVENIIISRRILLAVPVKKYENMNFKSGYSLPMYISLMGYVLHLLEAYSTRRFISLQIRDRMILTV